MPRPAGDESRYVAALDGIRALAVIAVVGYHTGIAGFGGGLLGVGVFFTLSGFLITDLLLTAYEGTGVIDLATFWLRRARRLLPALVLVLAVVLLVTALVDRAWWAERLNDALASLFYISNWTTISAGHSYFAQVAGPGPLDHLWSLAVEEQFYIVWPPVLLLMLRVAGGDRRRVVCLTVMLAVVSFVLLAVLAHPGFDTTRAYEGTDTRAGQLLVGAVLAMVYRPMARVRAGSVPARILMDAIALASLAVIGWLVVETTQYSLTMYRGGMLVLSLATAVLVAAVVRPTSLVGAALGAAPLRWVGERSYGIYLWHLPVIAFTPQSTFGGYSVRRTIFHIGLTVLLAALSWRFIEDPIRRHGLAGALRRRVPETFTLPERRPLAKNRSPAPPVDAEPARRPRVALGTFALVGAATAVLCLGVLVSPAVRDQRLTASMLESRLPALPPLGSAGGHHRADSAAPNTVDHSRPTRRHHRPSRSPKPIATTAAPVARTSTPDSAVAASAAHSARPQTSCTSVVHVGDSTSLGLMDPRYLPRSELIDAQYRDVGVRHVQTDILGARSIVEEYEGQPNADEATQRRIAAGYDGCWVFAMGTNDAANQAVGGVVPLTDRIERLMNDIHGAPALWLTAKTLLSSGPWADVEMQKWNDALEHECRKYPNLHVYDWRSQVKDSWYISDGIHFTSTGYRERGHRIADALAMAFPKGGAPVSGCLVVPTR